MARRGAFGRRRGEEDSDRRGSLEVRKGELPQCKRVVIKQLTGRRLPISTGERGGASAKTYSKSNEAGLRHG